MSNKLSTQFGVVCELRSKTALSTSAELLRWLNFSTRTHCYQLFYDSLNKPIGYIIWANVCRETITRLARTGQMPRYPYEWNEGYITLVLDLVFIDGWHCWNRKTLLGFLRTHKSIAYYRKHKIHVKIRHNETKFSQFPPINL